MFVINCNNQKMIQNFLSVYFFYFCNLFQPGKTSISTIIGIILSVISGNNLSMSLNAIVADLYIDPTELYDFV